MKTLSCFFIFLISLTAVIPKADISQLKLLGNLFTHFSDYHASEEQDADGLAFLEFIAEHYSALQHEHQDEGEHEELPFKEFTSSGFYVLNQKAQLSPIYFSYDPDYDFSDAEFYPIGFSASIDHPPSV